MKKVTHTYFFRQINLPVVEVAVVAAAAEEEKIQELVLLYNHIRVLPDIRYNNSWVVAVGNLHIDLREDRQHNRCNSYLIVVVAAAELHLVAVATMNSNYLILFPDFLHGYIVLDLSHKGLIRKPCDLTKHCTDYRSPPNDFVVGSPDIDHHL